MVTSIDVIHDVVIELEARVYRVFAVGPGNRIFRLNRGVMEDLNTIGITHSSITEAQRRQDTFLNTGKPELLWQVSRNCVGILFIIGRKNLHSCTNFIYQRWRYGTNVVHNKVL